MLNEIHPHHRKIVSWLLTFIVAMGPAIAPGFAAGVPRAKTGDSNTVSPIKHVIVIVGENRSFDHLFATYAPKAGETVNNLHQLVINPPHSLTCTAGEGSCFVPMRNTLVS